MRESQRIDRFLARQAAQRRTLFTVWRYSRGGWAQDGEPTTTPPKPRPCTHAGPCKFPFKQCDGGVTFTQEEA